jgi:hypothetical protein
MHKEYLFFCLHLYLSHTTTYVLGIGTMLQVLVIGGGDGANY